MDDDEEIDVGEGPEPVIDPKDLKSSRGWLALIEESGKVFEGYQSKCDNIEKAYANLERLASVSRSREFALFWANIQVMGPSIYSRPPVPVVTPRFKDQKPIPRTASELIERSTVVTFDTQDMDGVMRLVRDDLNIVGRGVLWVRYEAKSDGMGQRCCIEWVHRRDFRHDPARIWSEVDWVAKASYLTREQMRKRFKKTSGDLYKSAGYEQRKDEVTGETDNLLKAKVWEIWSKSKERCYWVAEGCDKFLDEGDPPLELEGTFPCPRPVYATLQRASLVPVPDMLFYKDQLEEINEITSRVSALSESLRLKGFYPGGAGELADAIEAAMKRVDDNAILIPVSNWALIGNGQAKDTIVWIPLDMVATTIAQLIELRKQLIEDVYQIMGLSDIMRGQTEASETLGAQQLKSQYGSVRISDKQDELVRIARDVTRICAEIMAENFSQQSLLDMSQMEIPTNAEIANQAAGLRAQYQAQIAEAQADPQLMQQAQQNPEQAQQVLAQAQQQLDQQIAALEEIVTIEDVMKFLRDNRARAFALDIETDSTITPDENAQKQRATEYVTAMASLFAQIVPALQTLPQAAPLAADVIKFVNSQFRVGRQFEQTIEEFTDQMKQMAGQPKGPSPEQMAAEQEKAKQDAEQQAQATQLQIDQQQAATEAQTAEVENAERAQALQAKAAKDAQDLAVDAQKEIDAAALRQTDIAAKAKLSEVQLASAEESRKAQAERHAQDMQAGALNIVLLRTKIAQAGQAGEEAPGEAESPILTEIKSLIEVMAKPKTVTAPDGRKFTMTLDDGASRKEPADA